LAGAVLAISSGVRTPGGTVAAASALLLGGLTLVELRRPAAVSGWVRGIPYLVLVAGATLIITARF
jgi:hypothetical protein